MSKIKNKNKLNIKFISSQIPNTPHTVPIPYLVCNTQSHPLSEHYNNLGK